MSNYLLTEDEYVESVRLYSRPTPKKLLLNGLLPVALVTVFMFTQFREQGALEATLISAGAVAGMAVGLLTWQRFMIPIQARKLYRQLKSLHSPMGFTWDAEGTFLSGETGSSRTPWSHYRRVRESASMFLLYLTDNMYHAVPKRVLADSGEIDRFRQACASLPQD